LRVAPALGSAEWNETQTAACLAAGFAMAEGARRYRTLVVDLRPPLETVRKSLAGNWRGHLNRAERQGLRVCAGADVALFEEFCRLFDGLIDRKGFEVDLDARFHADVQRALDPSEQFLVTLAYQDGEAVSGHVASLLGDTCVYLLGATSRRGLERQAAYLLQWHVMATARERGCTSYDLGGIDPEANPGVYDFKKGLRGIELFSPGPFEAAPRGVRRWLALRGERLYRALRDRIGARG
jgi:lipid II:glycine glycyltransferase (peptidoglycan interpeptide bridge formation enzyme)